MNQFQTSLESPKQSPAYLQQFRKWSDKGRVLNTFIRKARNMKEGA